MTDIDDIKYLLSKIPRVKFLWLRRPFYIEAVVLALVYKWTGQDVRESMIHHYYEEIDFKEPNRLCEIFLYKVRIPKVRYERLYVVVFYGDAEREVVQRAVAEFDWDDMATARSVVNFVDSAIRLGYESN